ncbi:MAG: DoxX family protein [Paracoccaceae bacterium]
MIQAITTKIAQIHALLATAAPATLGSLARLIFGGVLLMYFWASAGTKLGDGAFFGLFSPSSGAFIQMFPRAMEASGYNPSELSALHHLIAIAGTWAEFALPLLIVIGLATRLAALGMIGFVIVQSLTDIFGHQAEASTIGAWFDKASDALILDQRAFWMFALISLVMLGAGPLSLDRLIARKAA